MSANSSNRIAIQGIEGCFHHIAAKLFQSNEEVEVAPYDNFESLVEDVANENHSRGIIAIENSLAGSILNNYRLLHKYHVIVRGEVFLRIRQNLLGVSKSSISQLREVHSHPMALAQSSEFLRQYPHIKLIESADTAESAKIISEKKQDHIGAVASTLAAEIYDLDILGKNIENHSENYTRFLIIEKPQTFVESDKASISFTLSHKQGALLDVLKSANDNNLNLTKIQSAPIEGERWRYRFFVDLVEKEGLSDAKIKKVFAHCTESLEIIGIYPEGKYFEA